jgi:LPXTG-site transpeptidase (sortase) family protein
MFIKALKIFFRRPLVLIAIIVVSLLFLFYLTQGNKKSASQNSTIQSQIEASPGLPVRLIIPAINVDANIQQVGITSEGDMEVPSNTVDVGWFKLGSRPGEKGSAVISGHVDGKNGEVAVFTNLDKLKKGDKLYIQDDKGTTTSFVVRESRTYTPGYAEEVFSLNDSAHLNLVTCDGVWDKNKKIYTKRLVLFTDEWHL